MLDRLATFIGGLLLVALLVAGCTQLLGRAFDQMSSTWDCSTPTCISDQR